MALVRNDAHLMNLTFPAVIHPGEMLEASATFINTGDDAWPAGITPRADTAAPKETARPIPVYLGTANPANHASVFFNYQGWTSPRMACLSADGEIAPGAQGRFVFTLCGPRELGPATESFRLIKVPIAPATPVSFGDTATATIRVDPWDITRPPAPEVPATPAAPNAALPISGWWDIYAHAADAAAEKRSYQIMSSTGTQLATADQAADADGWIKLGRYRFDDPKKAGVTLVQGRPEPAPNGSIRFVGPFPAL